MGIRVGIFVLSHPTLSPHLTIKNPGYAINTINTAFIEFLSEAKQR
jgi:hypothetical protein